MINNRAIITYVNYLDKKHLSLFYLDSSDRTLEIIELDSTRVGEIINATVIKKLKNNDGICKLSDGNKAYIKQLNKLNEQDNFIAQVISDQHDNKDMSIVQIAENTTNSGCIISILKNLVYSEVVTDIPNIYELLFINNISCRLYSDDNYLLKDMYHLEKKLSEALKPRYLLKNGANIVIESTEALTVIDINSASSGRIKTQNFALDINKSCVKDIIKQIRLRSISGIIIIDFINMSSVDDTNELLSYFRDIAQNYDPDNIFVYDITALGLMEITRKRKYKPLIQQFM